jgi:hypothetical protein
MTEKYLDGQLAEAELEQFQARLERDPQLREDIRLYAEVRSSMQARLGSEAEEQNLRRTLKTMNEKYTERQREIRQRHIGIRKLWIAAASVAAVLILALIIWWPWRSNLYEKFARHPIAELAERDANGPLTQAENAYNNGDYSAAVTALNECLKLYPDDPELILLQGISFLEQDSIDQAIGNFRRLYSSDTEYADDGAWYLALTFLKTETLDSTSHYLSRLDLSSPLYEESIKLKRRLDR